LAESISRSKPRSSLGNGTRVEATPGVSSRPAVDGVLAVTNDACPAAGRSAAADGSRFASIEAGSTARPTDPKNCKPWILG